MKVVLLAGGAGTRISEESVYRPHCWGLFGGSDDPTGADFRACANFGPLYATNR